MTAIVIVSAIALLAVVSVRFGRDSRPTSNDRQDWQSRR